MRATSSSSPATPTSTIRASAWRWSAACWKRRASASASSPSRTGTRPTTSARWAGRTCSSASPPATWIRWSTATPPTARSARDDAYTPDAAPAGAPTAPSSSMPSAAARPSRTCPVVIGGIEASLRRIAHYDYWSDKVRRSILPDAKADLLLFGNAERALVEVAHRLAKGETIADIRDLRGTAFMAPAELDAARRTWHEADATRAPRSDQRRTTCRPPALLRTGQGRPDALRRRLARVPSRNQSRQRPRPGAAHGDARPLAQPAADPADHRGDGPRLRPALRPRAASRLRRRARSRPGR